MRFVSLLFMCVFLNLAASVARCDEAVSLVAVGDINLGRGVARQIAAKGVDYPFEKIASVLRNADITFGNLECALSEKGRLLPKRFSFRGDPSAADGLSHVGFDIVSLANNHSLDCGRDALAETTQALKARGISAVGAGTNAAQAVAPNIIERKGLKIAFLARTMVPVGGVIYREDAPTVAMLDVDELVQAVRETKPRVDVVVVSLHWGIEFTRQPREEQRRIAHRLVDAGSDLILGHHPHTTQPVERYRAGLIAYSLGNFVFDPKVPRASEGILLRCDITKRGVQSWKTTHISIRESQPRVEQGHYTLPTVQ